MRGLLAVVFAVFLQISEDGYWARLVNPDPYTHYCWVVMENGRSAERLMYPGEVTPWIPVRDIEEWGCKG